MLNTHQQIRLFQIGEICFSLFVALLFFAGLNNTQVFLLAYELGKKAGDMAVLALSLTLVPGMLKRLQWFTPITRFLSPIRRHLGITTYLLALSHYLLVTLLSNLLVGTIIGQLNSFVLAGATALLFFTPLFITSNDYSVRLLRRNWAKLQKLIYVATIFVFLHLLFLVSTWALLAGTVLLAEVISHLSAWAHRHQAVQAPSV